MSTQAGALAELLTGMNDAEVNKKWFVAYKKLVGDMRLGILQNVA